MNVAVRPATLRACPCGSGLSHGRCCKLDLASFGSPEANRHLLPLEQRAILTHRGGDGEAAERLALDVLELAPGRTGALTVLYNIRKTEGRAQAAEALIRRIVTFEPNNFWATNELALLLMNKGDLVEAERHARNAVRMAPENPQAHNLMGMILTEGHRPAVGEYHYRRALVLSGSRDPILLANMAWCLKNQGKMLEARALYQESLKTRPEVLQTLVGFARLEEVDRNLDAATALLDRAEAVQPNNPSVHLARAVVLGRKRDAPAALALLDRMEVGNAELGPSELLEKGRLLDQMGRYQEAFAAFVDGKRRLRELTGNAYAADHVQALFGRLIGFFTGTRLATLPRAAMRGDSPQPLFVLGFPRSGTTLVEQTLTAHPRIAAGDELQMISDITNIMPRLLDSPLTYPEALVELWMGDHHEDLGNLRDYYLQKVAQLGILREGANWFTDKMPLNETHLGLISLMFPESPMIHVVRHPLDVVLSVFSNLLTHGFYCAYSLESAATHYVRTMELVEHYRREMGLRYLQVRYEDIIDDQEASIRRILAFVGEEFDPRCLAFHENTRYARTASYAQVSERLYDRSRYRYRHYLRELEPVFPILQPVIERLGYTI